MMKVFPLVAPNGQTLQCNGGLTVTSLKFVAKAKYIYNNNNNNNNNSK